MNLNIQEFINKIKTIQSVISKYIEDDTNYEENFQNYVSMIQDQKIQEDKHLLELLLRYISNICNHHHRNTNFISKIERMIRFLSKEIKQFFTDIEIFHFFKTNKRLLLYLHEEQIMIMNNNIIDELILKDEFKKSRYMEFFIKEIMLFPNYSHKKGKYTPDYNHYFKNYYQELSEESRKLGENDNDICKLIQKDLVKEFIVYINKNSISLNSKILQSIYETNQFLIEKKVVSLIEYAAFFGSIQIFNYLRLNGVELTSSLWLYAIHSNNSEIIQILDENQVDIHKEKEDKSDFNLITYEDCFLEAIKCHHNDIAFYFYNNFLTDQGKDLNEYITNYLQYYNFSFIDENLLNESDHLFNYYCKYDYYNLVKIFLSNKRLDVNKIFEITSYIKKISWTYYYTDGELKEEKSALYYAIENDNYEIAKLLLNNDKIDINMINKESYVSKRGYEIHNDIKVYDDIQELYQVEKTVLSLAVEKRNIEFIKLLLNKNEIDVNAFYKIDDINEDCNDVEITKEKKTALYLAVEKENIEIIKLLLNNEKIDVNLINQNGDSFTKGDNSLTEETVLNLAIENGNIEIVKLLLNNNKIDVNTINKKSQKRSPCHMFYNNKPWYEHFDSYRFLQQEFTALGTALKENNIEIVKLLLNNDKIDVNIIIKYDASFFQYKDKEDFNAWYEGTLLYLAIKIGNIEIIKLLLENDKIDVNIKTKIFEYSIKYYDDHDDNYQKLEYKAEEKKEEKSYISPLHLAVKKGNLEVINLLMHHKGIDLNVKDEQRKTPIDYASTEEIKQLLKKI